MSNVIKNQLKEQWNDLHPNVQQRFEREPSLGNSIVYSGVMHTVKRSFFGCVFAHLTRIIGNPLTPYQGCDVEMNVELFKQADEQGTFWRRTYYFPNKKPVVVTSIKKESKNGEMMECVGGGFGMLLKVFAENGELHFKSYRYFFNLFGVRIPIMHCLTPGETHVVHKDLGNGSFRFTISMVHECLGQTFYQDGVFSEDGK